jgi:hypothetical protein
MTDVACDVLYEAALFAEASGARSPGPKRGRLDQDLEGAG